MELDNSASALISVFLFALILQTHSKPEAKLYFKVQKRTPLLLSDLTAKRSTSKTIKEFYLNLRNLCSSQFPREHLERL